VLASYRCIVRSQSGTQTWTRKLRFVVNREHDGTGKKKILVLAEQLVHNAIEDSAAWAFSMILAGRRPWGRGTTPLSPLLCKERGAPLGPPQILRL
jgi:hypothetical protein